MVGLSNSMRQFQNAINDPFVDRTNLDFLEDEQLSHQKINYRKKAGFKWPHLELFREANLDAGNNSEVKKISKNSLETTANRIIWKVSGLN